MDPLSALSLAGTALEFLNFGIKTISTVKEIKSSHDSATIANELLKENAQQLEKLCQELGAAEHLDPSSCSGDERDIVISSQLCAKRAQEIQKTLHEVRTPSNEKYCRMFREP